MGRSRGGGLDRMYQTILNFTLTLGFIAPTGKGRREFDIEGWCGGAEALLRCDVCEYMKRLEPRRALKARVASLRTDSLAFVTDKTDTKCSVQPLKVHVSEVMGNSRACATLPAQLNRTPCRLIYRADPHTRVSASARCECAFVMLVIPSQTRGLGFFLIRSESASTHPCGWEQWRARALRGGPGGGGAR